MERIKLIIVDDDLASRNQIKAYLSGNSDYEVVADFIGGKAAIDWLRDNETDMVLCDMQMPFMTGIEFIQILRVIKEYIPVIAISSFDDYDYLRGCMLNGATDYLLKHELNTDRLISALDGTKQKYQIRPENSNIVRRVGFCIQDSALFTAEYISRLATEDEIAFKPYNLYPVAIGPDYTAGESMRATDYADYQKEILRTVMDISAQLLGIEYSYLFFQTPKYHLVLLVGFKEQDSYLQMMNVVSGFCDKLRRRMMRMLDLTITVGLGSPGLDIKQAVKLAQRMDAMLEDTYYLGGNRLFQVNITQPLDYGHYTPPPRLWQQLDFEIVNKDSDGIKNVIIELISELERARVPRDEVNTAAAKAMDYLLLNGYVTTDEIEQKLLILSRYPTFSSFQEKILEFYLYKASCIQQKQDKAYSPVVKTAIQYIERYYASDISLETCAAEAGLSYTHFSREFKRETGLRFVEYINHLRLIRAKSMLIRGALGMKEIAEKSGFRNYNYFFKVFKEYEGVTPAEFIAKYNSES